MSRNKFNRSMDGSRSEAVRIYNQRKTLKRQESVIKQQEKTIENYKELVKQLREHLRLERQMSLILNEPFAVGVVDLTFNILDKFDEV